MTGRSGSGETSRPTGNRWIGTSLETKIAEYILDIQEGRANQWLGCRWEDGALNLTRPSVRWGQFATQNMIIGGYDANRIQEQRVTGESLNSILAPGTWTFPGQNQPGTGRAGGAVFNNSSSTIGPALSVVAAAWAGEDPGTNYVAQISQNYSRYKRATDAHPRMELDHQNGRVSFGDGATTPNSYIGRVGAFIGVNNASLTSPQDNPTTSGRTRSAPDTCTPGPP